MRAGTISATFRSLSNRNFRYLWFGQVLSATAMHADMVARAWLVWDLTGSSASVASVPADIKNAFSKADRLAYADLIQ